MQVSQVMQRDFITVQSTESIQDAAKKMREKHLGTVLVLEEDHIKGILTEKELIEAMASISTTPGTFPSDVNVMSTEPSVNDNANRCCYFSDLQVELLMGR